jgi:hypothetical protein
VVRGSSERQPTDLLVLASVKWSEGAQSGSPLTVRGAGCCGAQLGRTHMKLMACYDFSGTFDLQSDLIEIVQFLPPQRLLVTNETTIYGYLPHASPAPLFHRAVE